MPSCVDGWSGFVLHVCKALMKARVKGWCLQTPLRLCLSDRLNFLYFYVFYGPESPSPLPWGSALCWLFPDECHHLTPEWWLWVISVTLGGIWHFQAAVLDAPMFHSPGETGMKAAGEAHIGATAACHCPCSQCWSPPPSGIAPDCSSSNPGRVSPWDPSVPNLHETSLKLLSHPKAAPVVSQCILGAQ